MLRDAEGKEADAMLNPGRHHVYLVTFYNKDVRALVKDNLSHSFFEDHWADVHTQDINADSEAEARAKLAERFPPEDGFVIESVVSEFH